MKVVLLNLIILISLNSYSQEKELYKSRIELAKDSLYDYGYGLEKYSNPIDSAFCYNDFFSCNIYFLSLDSLISIDDNVVLPIVRDDIIEEIKLSREGEIVNNITIPKRFIHLTKR